MHILSTENCILNISKDLPILYISRYIGGKEMIWQEADTIPKECRNCKKDCYSCDIAGKRWSLSQRDSLLIKRKMMVRAVERLQRKIAEIDKELKKLE